MSNVSNSNMLNTTYTKPGYNTVSIKGINLVPPTLLVVCLRKTIFKTFYGSGYYVTLQWSLYFKTTHGTKKMWSYVAGGVKIKVI